MAMQRTFAMIKPDTVKQGHTGKIIDCIEAEGFTIIALKKMQMSKNLAESFYAVHRDKPFFQELVDYMVEGPIVVMVLEKEGAIAAWRVLMGDTNPEKAAPGTIRKLYGENIGRNATHGSDAPATAETEIKLIFPEL